MEENNENQVTEPSEESNAVKTYTEAEVEEMRNQIKADYEKSFDDKFNKRWGREMSKQQRSQAKTNELLDLLKKETGKSNIDDLLELSYKQYGVEKPTNVLDTEDYTKLGKIDAKEFLDGGDLEEIEEEANRLAEMTDRTPREQAMFMELGKYLTSKKKELKREKEIKESGIDKEVLEDAEFKGFLSKLKDDVSVKDAYEMFEKIKPKKEKPFSTGSLTGTNVEDKHKVKEFYTEEEARQFTRKDFDKNPALWKAIQDSMTKWY